MFKIFLISLILVLSACSSAINSDTQYFVLTPSVQTATKNELVTLSDEKITTILQPIKIAEYLDQPGIVLQTDTHQIEVAHYHRWGEPLKRNLHRYVLAALSAKLPQHTLRSASESNSVSNSQQLEISIHQFNGTTDGNALLSGYWTLNRLDSGSTSAKISFTYNTKLTSDGYPELVKELALSLDQLCNDIAQAIHENNNTPNQK